MVNNVALRQSAYPTSGERLNHILDRIGFVSGYGRIRQFHQLLPNIKGLSNLSYSALRGWFIDSTPTIEKCEYVINELKKDYVLTEESKLLAVWWKLGGYYPFEESHTNKKTDDELISLEFQLTNLVAECVNELEIMDIEGKRLVEARNRAMAFLEKFADPEFQDCPEEILKLIITNDLINK